MLLYLEEIIIYNGKYVFNENRFNCLSFKCTNEIKKILMVEKKKVHSLGIIISVKILNMKLHFLCKRNELKSLRY